MPFAVNRGVRIHYEVEGSGALALALTSESRYVAEGSNSAVGSARPN